MRIGIDGRKIPGATKVGALAVLDHAAELGVTGVFYRTVMDMSPTLDPGELREIRQHADDLGMYVESGLGKVNPYAIPEAPELRRIGAGDTLKGFERMMDACAKIGCFELWAGTANYKPYYGRLAYDRFRTDVTWPEQLEATERFLNRLAPIARSYGIHINLETHEEITSFELVRLVEAVGPDVVGIVYDTSNPLQRGEHPRLVTTRVAPYVRQTHIKDAVVCLTGDGVLYQERPVGEGVIDFREILPVLAESNPGLNLSIENAQPWDEVEATYPTYDRELIPLKNQTIVEVFDPEWLAGHPDATIAEFAEYLRLAEAGREAISRGELAALDVSSPSSFGFADAIQAAKASIANLSDILLELGLS